MRKPYRWKRGALPGFDGNLIKDRPDWAARIGEIAARFNILEASASNLFMILLAGQDEAAFFIYYDVLKDPKRATRERIFTEIGEMYGLPKNLLSEIMDLWDDIQAVESCRNEVIHAVWSSIETHPDSLFAIKDRFEWLRNANAAMTCGMAYSKGLSNYALPIGLPTITEFYRYQLGDLDEIITDILAVHARTLEMLEKLASLMFQASITPPLKRAENIIRHLDRENENRRNADAARLQDQQLAPLEG